jgi:hypothetical protein
MASPLSGGRWFGPTWGAAFLGFPIGGAAATLLVGPIESVGAALIAGACRRPDRRCAVAGAATAPTALCTVGACDRRWHGGRDGTRPGIPGRRHDHAAAAPARSGRRGSYWSSPGGRAAGCPSDAACMGGGRDAWLAARLGGVGHNRNRPHAELGRVRLERSAGLSAGRGVSSRLPAAAKGASSGPEAWSSCRRARKLGRLATAVCTEST